MNTSSRDIEGGLGPHRQRRPRWRRTGLVIALVAAAVFTVWRIVVARAPEVAAYVPETLAGGSLTLTVIATSAVESTTLVQISSALSGAVRTVLFDPNDTVRAGQPLARPRPS